MLPPFGWLRGPSRRSSFHFAGFLRRPRTLFRLPAGLPDVRRSGGGGALSWRAAAVVKLARGAVASCTPAGRAGLPRRDAHRWPLWSRRRRRRRRPIGAYRGFSSTSSGAPPPPPSPPPPRGGEAAAGHRGASAAGGRRWCALTSRTQHCRPRGARRQRRRCTETRARSYDDPRLVTTTRARKVTARARKVARRARAARRHVLRSSRSHDRTVACGLPRFRRRTSEIERAIRAIVLQFRCNSPTRRSARST